ncbi:flagellar motor switch protein FliM [Novipirellula artificiosorum]|uniref:Flagellar motor switch protein FliM n=1 Tax=Novipirellula artificiosorum TaxID=2528016 RepID=A0A5C6DMT3_9BACT|nr:flagellar motor switch protein FliM [Novipirellula artificiosorum]TWU36169.1 Flagellar motor switch protein FliM [Novipirellula artificiosorum]
MSDESLSQNQVESLLKAMESVDAPGTAPAGARTVNSPRSKATAGQSKPSYNKMSGVLPAGVRVTAYDFKRPERVGKDQMRAMHSLHETLARNFGAAMSGLLRTMIEVKLLSVDQLTYSEFVFSLDNPSCFSVLKPQPLEGHWILDVAPTLSYAVIDRMLGGDPKPGDTIRRPLTEIETRLVRRIVDLFLTQLSHSWENIVALDLEVDRMESNPQLVQIVPPNEVVILVGFEVLLGKNRGMMNLCIPFNTIEGFNSQLSRNGWVGYGKGKPTEKTRRRISNNIDAAPVDVVVTLARSRIRTGDLLELSVGDVITTEKEVNAPLELSIQNIPKFNAKAGAFKGKKAVRIESMLQPKHPVTDDDESNPNRVDGVADAGE